MSDTIQEKVDPNQPAAFDENFLKDKRPCWMGLPFEHTFTVRQINSRYPFLDEQQLELGRVMFRGIEQWDATIVESRSSQCRPTLTLNMIPTLLARAKCNSMAVGEESTLPDLDRCAAILGMENADPQRMYNYQFSMICEMEMVKPPKVIMSADSVDSVGDDGTVFVKPSRNVHRNWFVRLMDRVTRWIDRKA